MQRGCALPANLTARVVERFPGTILESEIVREGDVEKTLFDRTADLVITRRPIALPNCDCTPFMVEKLFLNAHATFFLVALKDAPPERVRDILAWVRETE